MEPQEVEIVVESPLGSFVKRRADGRIDFLSPVPSPYNYGSVPGTLAPDGDPLDAIALGPRLPRGAHIRLPVRAVVRFFDAGAEDRKLVCSAKPLSRWDRARIELFFQVYVRFKRVLNAARRRHGETRYEGIEEPPGSWPQEPGK